VSVGCLRALDREDSGTSVFIPLGMLCTDSQQNSAISVPISHEDLLFGVILLRGFTGVAPEFITPLISTGTTIEKIKRWEKVDKCLREELKATQTTLTTHLVELWLVLLSRALLDHEVSS
jgi:hypothetical protein